jgi:hypothetical protein
MRYRCRDSCLTTVNRQSSQVGDDVADGIATGVRSVGILRNKIPGGSLENRAFGIIRLFAGELVRDREDFTH